MTHIPPHAALNETVELAINLGVDPKHSDQVVRGTVFEITDSGFVVFAGTPGTANCNGKSVSALAQKYGGINAAASALGFPSVQALQNAIRVFCGG